MRTIPYFKVDPVLVLILSVITCGLYLIYWNLKVAEVVNAMLDREIISPPLAAVSGCCLPLNLYFYFRMGEVLPELGRRTRGISLEDKGALLLVLGFFFPFVAAMILQSYINDLYSPRA